MFNLFRKSKDNETGKGMDMYLVVGLGNPGDEYKMTRHNIGFEVIDYIAGKYNVKVNKIKFKGVYGEYTLCGEKVILLKPQTFMNLSGDSVREIVSYYHIPRENVIVICDDIAIEAGKIRIRAKGGPGGHNGLKSIIANLQSEEFTRIRMGVGAPEHKGHELADYVLGRFTKDDIPVMEQSILRATDAIEEIVKNDVNSAMNKFNGIK